MYEGEAAEGVLFLAAYHRDRGDHRLAEAYASRCGLYFMYIYIEWSIMLQHDILIGYDFVAYI